MVESTLGGCWRFSDKRLGFSCPIGRDANIFLLIGIFGLAAHEPSFKQVNTTGLTVNGSQQKQCGKKNLERHLLWRVAGVNILRTMRVLSTTQTLFPETLVHIFEVNCFFAFFLIFFYRKNSDGTIEDQWRNEQNSVVLGRNCCENILRELVDEFDRDQMIPGIRHSRRCCNRWPMVIYVCIYIYIYMGDSLNCGTPKNTLKWSFLVGKPMFVLYHHFRKHRFQIISK